MFFLRAASGYFGGSWRTNFDCMTTLLIRSGAGFCAGGGVPVADRDPRHKTRLATSMNTSMDRRFGRATLIPAKLAVKWRGVEIRARRDALPARCGSAII